MFSGQHLPIISTRSPRSDITYYELFLNPRMFNQLRFSQIWWYYNIWYSQINVYGRERSRSQLKVSAFSMPWDTLPYLRIFIKLTFYPARRSAKQTTIMVRDLFIWEKALGADMCWLFWVYRHQFIVSWFWACSITCHSILTTVSTSSSYR